MKIRNGFVSNSSSSSFIVAVKDEESAKTKIQIEVDLSKYASDTIKTIEELDSYVLDNYAGNEENISEFLESTEDYIKEEYAKMIAEQDKKVKEFESVLDEDVKFDGVKVEMKDIPETIEPSILETFLQTNMIIEKE